MSEHFFEFTIHCPKCGHKQNTADGFSTDDWTEVFVFSGYSEKSSNSNYNSDYSCPSCGQKINRDSLYSRQLIELESPERLIDYLKYNLSSVIESGGLYDHGWEPDLDMVLYRYSLLYPHNRDLVELRTLYYKAVHDREYFTKFEPPYGTSTVSADSIPYKNFLEKIYLPDTVTEIGEHSFSKTRIQDLFMPRNVHFVGDHAFEGCFNLSTVHTSDALTEIGDYAFSRTKIRKFFFSNGIRKIGKYAFKDTLIREVFIPSGCESIGEGAFADCIELKKVTIPKKFKDIESFFEPTADVHYTNVSCDNESEPNAFKVKKDSLISYYVGHNDSKMYDLMVNFTCSKSTVDSGRKGSMYHVMNDDCLTICGNLINDPSIPIGTHILTTESGITITDALLNVKVPELDTWKYDGNFEKIKEIYSMIIKYAADNHFRNIAFPLWAERLNFQYYSELLLYIKPILKTYSTCFDNVSWYSNSEDFFYDPDTSIRFPEKLNRIFHKIEIEML